MVQGSREEGLVATGRPMAWKKRKKKTEKEKYLWMHMARLFDPKYSHTRTTVPMFWSCSAVIGRISSATIWTNLTDQNVLFPFVGCL